MRNVFHILSLIVFCGGIVSCSSEQNQETTKLPYSNTILTKTLEQKADEFILKNEVDSAIYWMNLVLKTAEPTDEIKQARFFIKLGSFYFQKNDFKKSISYIKYGIEIFRKQNQRIKLDDLNYRNLGIILLANNYRIIYKYDSSLFYLDSIESEINKRNKNDHYYKNMQAEIFSWKGLVYFDMYNIEKAIMYNMKAIDIRKKLPECSCVIANNYSLIGEIYTYSEDFIKAELYQQKAVEIIRNCFGDNSLYYAEKITGLGYLYYESKQYKDALFCFEISNSILTKNLPKESPYFASSYNNLADAFCKLGLYQEGINYYYDALKLFKENNFQEELCIVYHNLGNVYSVLNDYQSALQYYNKSLELSRESRPANNISTSYTYQGLGQLSLNQKKYTDALEYFNNAIQEVCFIEPNSIGLSNNFIQNYVISKVELLESLYYKGYCEYLIYLELNEYKYLQYSTNSFQQATQLIDLIRNQYINEESKILINNISIPLYSNYLLSLLELQKYNHDEKIDNQILQCIERAKYTALRSSIYLNEILYNSGLPTNLIQLVDTLQKKIKYFENIISLDSKHIGQDCEANRASEEQLFKCIYSYDSLAQYIKNHFPKYKRNIDMFSYDSLKSIQNLISDSSVMVNYCITDSILLIFAISNTNYIIHYNKTPKNLLKQKDDFIKSILFSDIKTFLDKGNSLYKNLLQPIEPFIADFKHLIIIPDEKTLDIPFEALIKPDSKKHKEFNAYNFLIKQFEISYHYSANLWSNRMNKYKKNRANHQWQFTFSGFAPLANEFCNSQGDTDSMLYSLMLPYTKQEVFDIAEIFSKRNKKAIAYIGEESCEEEIINGLKNSQILHIATHSFTSSDTKDFYFLLSINNQYISSNNLNLKSEENRNNSQYINDGKLHLAEIYTLDIASELVTISSCCSGNGVIKSGEGILSLARGFYYSGAENILYTLWSVSDKHTMYFMLLFYQYVDSGYSYSVALQKTKIDFINSKNQLPKFWCGFLLNS